MLLLLPLALAVTPPKPAPAPVVPLEASGPPVDWLFVLDTAGEMLPVAQATRADIAGLVEQLPEGDRVEVMVFHTRPGTALPPTTIKNGDRATLVQQIRDLELNSAADSDLGAGLAGIHAELTAAGASSSTLAFVVSRFCHDPTVSSEYDTGGHGCRTIRGLPTLVGAGEKIRGEHDVLTRLFPAAPKDKSPDPGGLDAARQIFAADVVRDQPFSAWLPTFREHLAAERLRPIVAGDVRRAQITSRVDDPGTATSPKAMIELAAPLKLLKMELTNVKVDGGTLDATTIELGPKATIPVGLPEIRLPFALFPAKDTVNHELTLSADVSLEPADLLRDLGISTTMPRWSAPLRVEVPREYGLPSPFGFLIVGGLALAGVGGAVWWRLRSLPRELGGTFHWRRGLGPRVELDIAHKPEIGLVVEGDALVAGPVGRAVLVFRVTGPRWRPIAEVEVRQAGVEMNRKAIPPGRHPVTPGAASFQFGEFRLVWE